MPTEARKPGRPSKAEVEARGPAEEVDVTANTPNRQMVPTFMRCCGRWDQPKKIKDFPDRVLVQCCGCGKRVTLYPMRQVVH